MKQMLEEMKWFYKSKLYMIATTIVAVCGYGFAISHPAIGVDDTMVGTYLEDGLEVVMGRWTVFLINKLFHLSEFAPFMLELVGVILLMAGTMLFCVLWKRILGERVGIVGYTVFACLMLTNPVISEVNIYYYHNGSDLAYIFLALSLLSFLRALDAKGKSKIRAYVMSLLAVWVAVGCYESFIILFLLGVVMLLFFRGFAQKEEVHAKLVFQNLFAMALIAVGCVALRTVIVEIMVLVFGLGGIEVESRSISEMLVLFQSKESLYDIVMLVKRYILVYFVNAIVYLPALGYVVALTIYGIVAMVQTIKRKNVWYLVLFAAILTIPFCLTLIEAKVTYYRSCQYMPVFVASAFLLLYAMLSQRVKGKQVGYLVTFAAVILIYNQASMMNQNFYMDYRKYQHVKETLTGAAEDVERLFGTGYPVVFVGSYEIPYEFVKDYYLDVDSEMLAKIDALASILDENLVEKYYDDYGYSFAGEAQYSLIEWGMSAFGKTGLQLFRFLEMHGYELERVEDEAVITEAFAIGNSMPDWPAEGSIVKWEDKIIVNF